MTSRMYLVFFVVAQVILVNAGKVEQNVLQSVFGSNGPINSFAPAAVPPNSTLVDPDYWDSEDDVPNSGAEYDTFDWAITKRLAGSSDKNFLLSPLGLKLALAILSEAATGETRLELASVLGFDLDRHTVRRKFASIIESLKKKSPEYILNLGSRIYISNSAKPRQQFAAIAEEFYKTQLKTVNFMNPAEAAKEINAWISNITQGRIPNLVDKDDIVGVVALILNAFYFKGSWRHQFPPNATAPGPFHVTPAQRILVPFMSVQDQFYMVESAKYDAKILRMPYRGNKFAFYFVVPNSITGLPRIMNSLGEMRGELNNLVELPVKVTLPKFKFDYTSQLDGVLKEMGVRQAFGDFASFPGIARGQLLNQRLKVSKILQRSSIEVNELGSIAYSATEIALVNKFGEDDTINFEVNANKPFMFFIQDESTRQLLFTGRVNDPSQANGDFKS